MLRIHNLTLRNTSKKAGLGAAGKSRDQFQTGPSYLRLFFLGQTRGSPLCQRRTESRNSSIVQRWSKSVTFGGTSGQQWSIHTLVLCLMQKTQDLGLAVTGLQPVASATSQIPWSAPTILPSPFSWCNLIWEMLTRWKVKLYLKQSSKESHVTALIC